MIRYSGKGIGQPSLWVNLVQLGGFNRGVGDGSSLAAGLQAHKEIILSADDNGTHRAFCSIVIQFQDAVIENGPKPGHAFQCIADSTRQWLFAGDTGQLGVQPYFQIIEDRLCLRLPDLDAMIGW